MVIASGKEGFRVARQELIVAGVPYRSHFFHLQRRPLSEEQSLMILAAAPRASGVPTCAVSSQKNRVSRSLGIFLSFPAMCGMTRAKSGLDKRQPYCVPENERTMSRREVMSLGSMWYSHHARFVSSGHILAVRYITRLRSAVLKAFSKSSSKMASSFVVTRSARLRMAWIPISYPPCTTPSCVPDTSCVMWVLSLLQYAFVSNLRREHPILPGLTSTFCLSLYNAIRWIGRLAHQGVGSSPLAPSGGEMYRSGGAIFIGGS